MKSCNLNRVAVSQKTSKALSTEPEYQSEYLQNIPTSSKNKKKKKITLKNGKDFSVLEQI